MSRITGRGWAFPPYVVENSRIALVEDDRDVQQSIFVILNTVPGERVMRPEFGCQIHDLIFFPVNDQTAAEAERYVREALERWEPRITVHEVRVSSYDGVQGGGELFIELKYEIKDHHDVRSLVYPFSLLPA